MYFVVAGGGEVGYHLSKALLEAGHEVMIIERDRRRALWIEEQLGSVVRRDDDADHRVPFECAKAGNGSRLFQRSIRHRCSQVEDRARLGFAHEELETALERARMRPVWRLGEACEACPPLDARNRRCFAGHAACSTGLHE